MKQQNEKLDCFLSYHIEMSIYIIIRFVLILLIYYI